MAKPNTAARQAASVRIIAGDYRRRLLPVIETSGLRPTPDRVRQTVFNWLNYWISDWRSLRVLDAFAGTGALGIEAASRGAGQVLLCESFAPAAQSIRASLSLLGAAQCRLYQGDATAHLEQYADQAFDLIFLDPPFHTDALERIAPHAQRLLAPHGLLYIESPTAVQWDGFEVLRHLQAGKVHAQLLRRKPANESPS